MRIDSSQLQTAPKGTLNHDRFQHVYLDESARGSAVAQRVLEIFPADKISWVHSQPRSEVRGTLSAREFDRSKREIYVTKFKGQFFKRCPGSKPGLACCNYFVLNLGLQCDMNCSYCYLQSFINSPMLTIYSNIDDAIAELREMHTLQGAAAVRIGTGETIDSLSLDDLTLYSRDLIAAFRDFPKWKLEFKTKSAKVDQFLDCEHSGNVIASWSINPQAVIDSEEHQTASLDERLKAAEKSVQRGFTVAFHIDPMIWHPDWKENYKSLINELNRRFDPKQIPYVSVGALRFQPEQRHMMRERFGLQSMVTQAEVFSSHDGKLRYDSTIRNEMYNFVLRGLKELNPAWNVFFCMESPESWLANFKTPPRKVEGLAELFEPIHFRT